MWFVIGGGRPFPQSHMACTPSPVLQNTLTLPLFHVFLSCIRVFVFVLINAIAPPTPDSSLETLWHCHCVCVFELYLCVCLCSDQFNRSSNTSWSPNSTYLHLDFYLLSWRWWPLWSGGTLYQWSLQPEKASQDPCLFKISVSCTWRLAWWKNRDEKLS